MTSTLDDEPEVVDTPHRDKELEAQDTDLEPSSDEDDEEEVSIKKRFEEIIRDLKSGTIDLRTEAVLKEFAIDNASYLDQKTTGDGDHNTLLHMLVEEAKDKVFDTYQRLVGLLLARYPQLLGEKDSNEKTPLYIAISKKRDKLVRFMCDAHPKIDTVLSIACYHSENCLHVAIRRNVSPKLAIFLIEKAGEGTLCAKDDKGNTPLNLAVDYDRATEAQLEIVEALVLQCDKAMDERTNAPNYFSPYRYHEYTRAEANKVKTLLQGGQRI
jgi:ankyrin repeat protein